jgi:short-subunit dehydrogenase
MELRGSSVLVTGATGGIGHAIVRHLHRAGADLFITGRRAAVLEPLAAETGARSLAVDLRDRDAVARLAEEAAGVDALVNNAAVPASGAILDFSIEQIDKAVEVNLRAPMVLSRLLAERMVSRGRGHIVLVSSLAGKSSQPSSSVYSATKFGLRGFGQGLRADLAPRGVGVSVIFPGFIREAGMFHEADMELPRGVGTSTPDEVAAAVVRAIEHNRGEVDVAPIPMRAGAVFASVAPGLAAKVAKRLGNDRVAEQLAEGQAHMR